MGYIYLIDWVAAQRIAALRKQGKTQYKSRTVLTEFYDEKGVAGEMAFSQFSGLPLDSTKNLKGDGGVDFILPTGHTVDVKTSSSGKQLLVSERANYCAVYVLAKWIDFSTVELVGWTVRSKVLEKPVDYGIIFKKNNHIIPAHELLEMYRLTKFIHSYAESL